MENDLIYPINGDIHAVSEVTEKGEKKYYIMLTTKNGESISIKVVLILS